MSFADYVIGLLPQDSVAAIKRNGSPQSDALQWLLDDPNLPDYPDWRKIQRYALATFFYSMEGEIWLMAKNWLSYNHSECTWHSQDPDLGVALQGLPEATQYGLIDSFPKFQKKTMP